MILSADQYPATTTEELLTSAQMGIVPFDQRLVKVLIDRAPDSIPAILNTAMDPKSEPRLDLSCDFFHILRHLRTPAAIPYFIQMLHNEDDQDPDEIYEALGELGSDAIEPLIELYRKKGPKDGGNAAFLLASLRKPDDRIRTILTDRLSIDPWDTALCLSLYGDPATKPAIEETLAKLNPLKDAEAIKELKLALTEIDVTVPPEPHADYDSLPLFSEQSEPVFEVMELKEILAFLESPDPLYRQHAVEQLGNEDLGTEQDERILGVATKDPAIEVRLAAWEALGTSPGKEVRQAIRAKAKDEAADPRERAAALVAATINEYNPEIHKLAEQLYEIPASRALALKAMWQTLKPGFNDYFPRHLDDADPTIRRQAIWGVGYLGLGAQARRLEEMFNDEDFRDHALFAYALCVPGEVNRPSAKRMLRKIEELADGLSKDELDAVESALDQRLQMNGHDPVFQPVEEHVHDENCGHDHGHSHAAPVAQAAASKSVGRNDPCPCQSGKKFKKCCGA